MSSDIPKQSLVPITFRRPNRGLAAAVSNPLNVGLSMLLPLFVFVVLSGGSWTWFVLYFAFLAMSEGGQKFLSTRSPRERTILVRPDKAQEAQLALESAMESKHAEKVWKAVGKATDSFGTVVDENFYSWVDAQVAALPANRQITPGTAEETDSYDSETGTRTTWIQPPQDRAGQ